MKIYLVISVLSLLKKSIRETKRDLIEGTKREKKQLLV